jgi:uncharacterized protein YggT (Ycf19 family)
MVLLDFILNLAGLLLWFNWRAAQLEAKVRTAPGTIANAIRQTAPSRLQRWLMLAALFGLICLRAWFYRHLGPAVEWTAPLNLGAIMLYFRSDKIELMLLFSTLSFCRTLVVVYFWLLFLDAVNRSATTDPMSKLIRLQLGRVAGCPRFLRLLLPLLFVAIAWAGLQPLLTNAGITHPASTTGRLFLQGLLIAAGTFLSLKYLVPALLFVHFMTSYVYFGSSPFWDFPGITGRNLLALLRRVPLRLGRMDFAPLVGIVLSLLLLHSLPQWILKLLERKDLTIWPQ